MPVPAALLTKGNSRTRQGRRRSGGRGRLRCVVGRSLYRVVASLRLFICTFFFFFASAASFWDVLPE
jgi:hypothetical protein